MSYNSLTSLGPVSRYPACLKQLDLSHNEISNWTGEADTDTHCYSAHREEKTDIPLVCGTPEPRKVGRSQATKQNSRTFCPHRRHVKLEQLRSLILADNTLREISLNINQSDSASSISEVRARDSYGSSLSFIFVLSPRIGTSNLQRTQTPNKD